MQPAQIVRVCLLPVRTIALRCKHAPDGGRTSDPHSALDLPWFASPPTRSSSAPNLLFTPSLQRPRHPEPGGQIDKLTLSICQILYI